MFRPSSAPQRMLAPAWRRGMTRGQRLVAAPIVAAALGAVAVASSMTTAFAPIAFAGAPLAPRTLPAAVPCTDLPVSSAVVSADSCWQLGPTTAIVAGTDPTNPAVGKIEVVAGQRRFETTLAAAGPPTILGVGPSAACVAAGGGTLFAVDLSNVPGRVPGTTGCGQSITGASGFRLVDLSLSAPAAPGTAPGASYSYYVYADYLASCGGPAPLCPMWSMGASAGTPATGGLTVLDFGAPCIDPNSGAQGVQMFWEQACTPDAAVTPLVAAWIQGYETTHNAHTAPSIVAVGMSNSVTSVGAPLSPDQMNASGKAWAQLVASVNTAGLPAPLTVWAGGDLEQENGGGWYSAPETVSWVDGYAAASGHGNGAWTCSASNRGMLVDFGDAVYSVVPSPDGWDAASIYHVAYGSPVVCPVPEIYYSVNADEWLALSQWAVANGLPAIQFTGAMSEDGADGTLAASSSWQALFSDTNQAIPFLTIMAWPDAFGS